MIRTLGNLPLVAGLIMLFITPVHILDYAINGEKND